MYPLRLHLRSPVDILNKTLILTIILSQLSQYGIHCHSFEDEERLNTFITEKTKPGIRPVLDQTRSINISVLPVLSELRELNAKDQTLKTSMALVLGWKQELIHWNESDFGGAKQLVFDARQIWTPDINFNNRVDYGNIITDDADKSFKVTLYDDGNVIWVIGDQLETSCTVDISWYPFDNQTCILEIATVTSTDPEIQLIPAAQFVHINMEVTNTEWTIHESPIYKTALHTDRSVLKVHILLSRKVLSHIMNTIIPVFILSFMNVLSFKIPLQSGERISYSVSLFLTFMVLLDMISDSIPNVSSQVSGLQLFVTLQLAFGAVVTSLSIALVKWSHSFSNQRDGGRFSIKCLKGLCTTKTEINDLDESEDGNQEKGFDGIMKQQQFFEKIDRVLFWFFLALYALAAVTLIILSC